MGTATKLSDLRKELVMYLPDFLYCERCGKPIWGVVSKLRGMGERCAILAALEAMGSVPVPEAEDNVTPFRRKA